MTDFSRMFQLFLMLLCLSTGKLFAQTDEQKAELEELIENEKYKKAIKICDQWISDDAKNGDAYMIKSDLLKMLEEYEEALVTLNTGLEVNPEDAWMYNKRGLLFQSYAMLEPALRDYSKGLEFAENDTVKNTIWLNQASAKSAMRDFQGAYDILQNCLAFDSLNVATLNNLAMVCDEVGKPELTELYLMKIVEIDTLFTPGYVNLGFMYQGRGEYQKSISYFDKALEIQPDEPYSYSNRSYSKLKVGDLEGALVDINKSIEIYPGNSYAYRNRALIYIAMDKKKKACEDLQLALDWNFTQAYGREVIELQRKHCN